MINNKPFVITYYSASDKKTITRNAFGQISVDIGHQKQVVC